jgi:hypothetical protein
VRNGTDRPAQEGERFGKLSLALTLTDSPDADRKQMSYNMFFFHLLFFAIALSIQGRLFLNIRWQIDRSRVISQKYGAPRHHAKGERVKARGGINPQTV